VPLYVWYMYYPSGAERVQLCQQQLWYQQRSAGLGPAGVLLLAAELPPNGPCTGCPGRTGPVRVPP